MALKVKLVAPQVPPAERIQTTFKQLSHAAVDLNTASDELSKPIYVCEAALKKLNLGIPAWVELSGADAGGYWWDRGLGYTQLKDRWGIALRTRQGHHADDEGDTEEFWSFNDAPRWMRIEAVAKLPDLLEALLKQAQDTTQKIRKRIAQANELVEAISKVADDSAVAEQK
jgi:hypothetical protein